jgi:hypothetical protein
MLEKKYELALLAYQKKKGGLFDHPFKSIN